MEPVFIISFIVCFICFIIRSVFNYLKFKKRKIAENKFIFRAMLIVMFILWASWFQMLFSDPLRISLQWWIRYAGLLIFITGASLFILAHLKIKGYKGHELKTTGIYNRLRNPMYLGFILWVTGLPLFMRAGATLITGILWIPFFIIWKALEEKELEEKFDNYKDYMKRTWF